MRKIEIDEVWLRKMYCDEGKSAVSIARTLGVSMEVVNKRLRDYGIRVRDLSESTSLAQFGSLQVMNLMKDPEWLRSKYVDEKLSTLEIAKLLGVTDSAVFRYISNHGIKLRTLSEARAKHPKSKKQPKTSRRKGKKNQITKTCAHCQKSFSSYPSIKTKFCSNDCYRAGQDKPVILTCAFCEEPFWQYLCDIDAGRVTGLHCSPACRHKKRRKENGTVREYPSVWNNQLRTAIRQRDCFECALCYGFGYDVHHIDYDKTNCDPKNLITLCHPCHSKTNFNRQHWIEVFAHREKAK